MDRSRLAAIGLTAALFLGACAGSDQPEVEAGQPSEQPSDQPDQSESGDPGDAGDPGDPGEGGSSDPAPADPSDDETPQAAELTIADIDAPNVDVMSVPSGDTVNVAELALGTDILFWFYAPH